MNDDFLKELGIQEKNSGVSDGVEDRPGHDPSESQNPATGEVIASVSRGDRDD